MYFEYTTLTHLYPHSHVTPIFASCLQGNYYFLNKFLFRTKNNYHFQFTHDFNNTSN